MHPQTPITSPATRNLISNVETNVHIGKVIGITGYALGSIALAIAIINACKSDYDWTILNSIWGGFSIFLGRQNIKFARHNEHQLNEIKSQILRLQTQYKYPTHQL